MHLTVKERQLEQVPSQVESCAVCAADFTETFEESVWGSLLDVKLNRHQNVHLHLEDLLFWDIAPRPVLKVVNLWWVNLLVFRCNQHCRQS